MDHVLQSFPRFYDVVRPPHDYYHVYTCVVAVAADYPWHNFQFTWAIGSNGCQRSIIILHIIHPLWTWRRDKSCHDCNRLTNLTTFPSRPLLWLMVKPWPPPHHHHRHCRPCVDPVLIANKTHFTLQANITWFSIMATGAAIAITTATIATSTAIDCL